MIPLYDIDEQLSHGMRELAATGPESTPPTGLLLARGQRARRRRTALTATSLALVAVGAVTGVAVANRPAAPAVTADPTAVSTPGMSPELELVAAITNSQNISFRLRTTAGSRGNDGKAAASANPGSGVTVTAFDAATANGYLRGGGPVPFEMRLVDGVRYDNYGRGWRQHMGRHRTLATDSDELRGQLSLTADAGQLLKALREGDARVTKTGAATYRFESTRPVAGGTAKLVGDITVGGDKRIARIAYDWALTDRSGYVSGNTAVLEYSGYGEPVIVERPAHAELVP
ncbi:hypothetical protein [Catellatospora methionotrophica]|uniref:hypothetical protein n=1 Tax=Catellatospora methionotrophica TaxID=121620 RepID=UPI003409D468